jgi:hypothetical protein
VDIPTKYLMLTHLIPSLGAESQGPFKIPGGPLSEADYRKAVEESGFTGKTIVGTDLDSASTPEMTKKLRAAVALGQKQTFATQKGMPLYSRKRTLNASNWMSATDQ